MERSLKLRHPRANGLKFGRGDYGQVGRAAGVVRRVKEIANRSFQMVVGKVVGSPTRTGVEDQVVDGFDLIVLDEDRPAIIAVFVSQITSPSNT